MTKSFIVDLFELKPDEFAVRYADQQQVGLHRFNEMRANAAQAPHPRILRAEEIVLGSGYNQDFDGYVITSVTFTYIGAGILEVFMLNAVNDSAVSSNVIAYLTSAAPTVTITGLEEVYRTALFTETASGGSGSDRVRVHVLGYRPPQLPSAV